MREAVIVSAARTPIGKAYRGAFNNTTAPTLGGHAIAAAVARAKVDPAEIDDVVMGAALQQGTTAQNIGRNAALRAGLPNTVSGMSMDRQCSSGLMAVATAAKYITHDGAPMAIGAGLESISLVQNDKMNLFRARDEWLAEHVPELQTSMIETAEIVADRYKISREAQDEYALQSQQRTAQAQAEGRFAMEIVPMTTTMMVFDKATGQASEKEVTIAQDEGNRPQTTLADLQKLQPVFKGGRYVQEGKFVTAGNASGLNDGAAALVLMSADDAANRGATVLGRIAGFATCGVDPSIMGIGPAPASRKALAKAGWSVGDLDLIEANEAFAAQALSVSQELGFDPDKVNVNGGAIAIGHPIGASGARVLTTLLYEMDKRDAKKGLATLCIGGGMGVAMCIER